MDHPGVNTMDTVLFLAHTEADGTLAKPSLARTERR